MDVEFYRNFITIVDTGNITEAAKKLHIVQSALSAQIKTMEQFFGTPLIITKRGIRKLEITDAGKMLYQKSCHLCSLEDIMRCEVKTVAKGNIGSLRISLSPSSSISFITNYLVDFSLANPGINYRLYEVNIALQTQQLLSGFTELGVANAPLHQAEKFETLYGVKEHMVAIFKSNSKYLSPLDSTISLESLKNVPICLSRGCSALFKSVCSQENFNPHILSINSTKTSTLCWAQKDCAVAIIPFNMINTLDSSLCCRPINDRRLIVNNSLVMVKNRPLSPVATHFLNFLRNVKGIEFLC